MIAVRISSQPASYMLVWPRCFVCDFQTGRDVVGL